MKNILKWGLGLQLGCWGLGTRDLDSILFLDLIAQDSVLVLKLEGVDLTTTLLNESSLLSSE